MGTGSACGTPPPTPIMKNWECLRENSEPPDDQARELARIDSQATGTVPLVTGLGGYL